MEIQVPRFRVRWIVITPGALRALLEGQEDPRHLAFRHSQGDWGELGPDDWAENEYALRHGERLISVFQTRHGRRLSLVTEGSRYSTTIDLVEDPEPQEKGAHDASEDRPEGE